MIEKQETTDKKIELYIVCNRLSDYSKKEDYLNSLINDLRSNNYYKILGFSDSKELESFFSFILFGKEQVKEEVYFNKLKILRVVEEFQNKCEGIISDDKLKIFIFPIYDKFVIGKMGGVSGFCTAKNTILIVLNPIDGWENNLLSSLVHELPHALSSYYDMSNLTIGEGLVFDGIAENLVEYIVDDSHSKLITVIGKKEALKIFKEIKDRLEIKDHSSYSEVFFGTGKYPLWAGYAIGYYLIKDYLKNKRNVDWKQLVRENPSNILKEITR